MILRPGLITREMIAEVVGDCKVYTPKFQGEPVKSPGLLYKHYSPRCETVLFTAEQTEDAVKAYREKTQENKRVCILCEDRWSALFRQTGAEVLNLGKNQAEMATNLYKLLRIAETLCDVLIAVEPIEKGGIMEGVLNRLQKACKSKDAL